MHNPQRTNAAPISYWNDDEPTQPTERVHVALVDDDTELRRLLARRLEREGFVVTQVANGEDLLDLLGDVLTGRSMGRLPDIVVCDIRMPGIDGMNILAGLRHGRWAAPIVLITSYSSSSLKHEARRLGATAVLQKPFHPDKLVELVEELAGPRP